MSDVLAEYELEDMVVTYLRSPGVVGLEVLPLGAQRVGYGEPDPLVHLAPRGAAASGGFVAGHSQRGSPDAGLEFVDHLREHRGDETTITTRFDRRGVVFRHVLCHTRGTRVLRTRTEVDHGGHEPLGLEMLSSLSLGGLSPLSGGGEPGALTIHRIRSTWSNEGRVVSEVAEDLQLEPSWALHGVRVERFGQVGSLPVRKFFPFVAVEDRAHAVVWAAQVATPGSWQIELWRRGRTLGLSGGLADWEFGHWSKVLSPGQTFVTPWAYLTVGSGDLDAVAQRLIDASPRPSHRLPQVFNEFCSTWGRPSEASVQAQVEALRGRGLDYFVVDAGWYAHPDHGWEHNHGDWEVAAHLFPRGLKPVVDTIRGAGMVPGLWFELETCGPLSRAFLNTDHLLKRGGHTLTSGSRRFWDLRAPWVRDYLSQRVLGTLSQGFGYIKVDYNESLGVGCDGESPGEGLRLQLEATQEFFAQLRRAGLVIENCASGGHRLEPSMLALSDFSSFSDAHECPEIPVLAANLHRLVPPWQCQIWAVIRRTDTPQRIVYSLAATCLGVLCLSGDVESLDATQWRWVDQGLAFHRRVDHLIAGGFTHYQGPRQASYRSLEGWQAIVRVAGDEALVVVHGFEGCGTVTVTLPWAATIVESYGQVEAQELGDLLRVDLVPWSAVALVLVRSVSDPGARRRPQP